ncbi:MAG TPA: aldehyde dehydrogenase family protein, partial [Thermoanaerobaculia bacterium]
KMLNSGQICIAPDYVLVDESVRDKFMEKMRAQPVHETAWLLKEQHSMPLTLLESPSLDSEIMREEIFGPLLPVIGYRDLAEALRIVSERSRPLVIYVFSRDRGFIRQVLQRTRAGGTVINDTLVHFFHVNLPFGGVGESGFGKAHGRFGFEAFSNARAVLDQRGRVTVIQFIYPPYTGIKQKLIDFALKYL